MLIHFEAKVDFARLRSSGLVFSSKVPECTLTGRWIVNQAAIHLGGRTVLCPLSPRWPLSPPGPASCLKLSERGSCGRGGTEKPRNQRRGSSAEGGRTRWGTGRPSCEAAAAAWRWSPCGSSSCTAALGACTRRWEVRSTPRLSLRSPLRAAHSRGAGEGRSGETLGAENGGGGGAWLSWKPPQRSGPARRCGRRLLSSRPERCLKGGPHVWEDSVCECSSARPG